MSSLKSPAIRLVNREKLTAEGLTKEQKAQIEKLLSEAVNLPQSEFPIELQDGNTRYVLAQPHYANNFHKRLTGKSIEGCAYFTSEKRVAFTSRTGAFEPSTAEKLSGVYAVAEWAIETYGSREQAIERLSEQYVRAADASVNSGAVYGAIRDLVERRVVEVLDQKLTESVELGYGQTYEWLCRRMMLAWESDKDRIKSDCLKVNGVIFDALFDWLDCHKALSRQRMNE